MNRLSSFQKPRVGKVQPRKSLRNNAREAAEYLTGLPYLPPKARNRPHPKPGRGASGESSN